MIIDSSIGEVPIKLESVSPVNIIYKASPKLSDGGVIGQNFEAACEDAGIVTPLARVSYVGDEASSFFVRFGDPNKLLQEQKSHHNDNTNIKQEGVTFDIRDNRISAKLNKFNEGKFSREDLVDVAFDKPFTLEYEDVKYNFTLQHTDGFYILNCVNMTNHSEIFMLFVDQLSPDQKDNPISFEYTQE